MNGKCGNGMWRWLCGLIIAVSLSILGTGYASWNSFGGGVKRSEVSEMIRTESPYVTDKSGIQAELKNIRLTLLRVEAAIAKLDDLKHPQ